MYVTKTIAKELIRDAYATRLEVQTAIELASTNYFTEISVISNYKYQNAYPKNRKKKKRTCKMFFYR